MRQTHIPNGTLTRLKEAHTKYFEEKLDVQLNSPLNRPGATQQKTEDDEAQIVAGIKDATICGVSLNVKRFKYIVARVSKYSNRPFKKSLP